MKRDSMHAVVLRRRPYRETSYLVDFFSRELGKVSAVCKGGRNSKSDKKSLLQPFQPLRIELVGRHELKNLGSVESTGMPFRLVGNEMFSAMYLNELLNRLLAKEMPHQAVFDLYLASLLRLADRQDIEPVLREFELAFLAELGVLPDWQSEAQSEAAIQPDTYYTFVSQQGFVPLAVPDKTQNCFRGDSLLKVHDKVWDKASLSSAKRITRMAFLPLLGDKPLKSRELFLQREQNK